MSGPEDFTRQMIASPYLYVAPDAQMRRRSSYPDDFPWLDESSAERRLNRARTNGITTAAIMRTPSPL
jgi:hypothetical protein